MWPANKKIRVMVVDDSIMARTMITNGLNMVNMNTYVQMMIKGLIIVAAIGFGSIRSRKK